MLQGGGALGAYQAGVYEALDEAGILPDWIGGISIGALNGLILAGNPPEKRVAKLREFWTTITSGGDLPGFGNLAIPSLPGPWDFGDQSRTFTNIMNASLVAMRGATGFFRPRPLSPWLAPPGSMEASSYYDTTELKATLERLVDFDRVNSGETRLSVGAVNVRSGNFVYFDTTTHHIRAEHAMASGALPPGFPAVEVDGEYYWDGGLVSNTPLMWVMDAVPQRDTLTFQVDLWNARGEFPRSMGEVLTRAKEIQFSSRTRANSDRVKVAQMARHAIAALHDAVPEEIRRMPEFAPVAALAESKAYGIVQLIYRAHDYEGDSKDYEFSPQSMEEHWKAGYNDTVRTLRHPEALARPEGSMPVKTFDIHSDGNE